MNHAEYLHYLKLATHQLQACAYTSAQFSLNHCLRISRQVLQQELLTEDGLEAYCKVVILSAATQLRLHQHQAAVSEFAQAMKVLHQLYYQVIESEDKSMVRRYQAVLVRASQCAHTVYRLKDCEPPHQENANAQVSVYH